VPAFHAVRENHTAGSPVRQEVLGTDLTAKQIQETLRESDLSVSESVVRQLLEDAGDRRRQMQKDLDMGQHRDRDAPFLNIARIQEEYRKSGDPIVSIDTTKKELLGTFDRDGKVCPPQALLAYDHDFPSYASGGVIPYGIDDRKRNQGDLRVGTSKDTSGFACDGIAWWRLGHGREVYRGARSICRLCDGGGSNSANQYLFKEDLQDRSNRLGIEIRVAHDPPYCSKYHPIERRLFCHVTRACQGVLFDSVATVVRLRPKTSTSTGRRVIVEVLDKVDQTGRKYTAGFKENLEILFDDLLPKWNYRAVPSNT
jgi:hypothetical protein